MRSVGAQKCEFRGGSTLYDIRCFSFYWLGITVRGWLPFWFRHVVWGDEALLLQKFVLSLLSYWCAICACSHLLVFVSLHVYSCFGAIATYQTSARATVVFASDELIERFIANHAFIALFIWRPLYRTVITVGEGVKSIVVERSSCRRLIHICETHHWKVSKGI